MEKVRGDYAAGVGAWEGQGSERAAVLRSLDSGELTG